MVICVALALFLFQIVKLDSKKRVKSWIDEYPSMIAITWHGPVYEVALRYHNFINDIRAIVGSGLLRCVTGIASGLARSCLLSLISFVPKTVECPYLSGATSIWTYVHVARRRPTQNSDMSHTVQCLESLQKTSRTRSSTQWTVCRFQKWALSRKGGNVMSQWDLTDGKRKFGQRNSMLRLYYASLLPKFC